MAENVGGIVWTASIETQQLVNGERQINQSTNRAGRNFDDMERKAASLNTRLTQVAKTLAGVFAVRQIQRFTMETIRSIDRQNTFAQSISVSYQELQKLQFAAEQNGATTNELNNSLRRLTRRTEEAARGTGAAVQAFENLGLNARELESLSPDQIFLRVADAFQQLEDGGKEVSTAFGLFDTEGAKLINTLRKGSAGIRELGDEAERSGRIISQQTAEDAASFNEELNKLQGAAKGAAVTLGAELVPAMTDLMTATTDWLSTGNNAENLIKGIGIAAQATAVVVAGRFTAGMWAAAASMRGATASAVSLRGALTFLGGPVGVAVIATAAIYKLSESYRDGLRAQDARREKIMAEYQAQKKLNEELANAGKLFEDTSQATATGAAAMGRYTDSVDDAYRAKVASLSGDELQEEFDKVERSLQRAERRMETVSERFAEGTLRYQQAQEAVRALRAQLDILNTTAAAVGETLGSQPTEESTKAIEALAERNEELRAALAGTSDELEVRRALQQAGVEAGTAEAEVIESLVRGNQGLANAIREVAEAEQRRQELEGVAASDLGLTRLQALEAQYERERQMLLEAQEAGIESEVSYQERLNEIHRQFSEERKQIIADETETWKDRLEGMGFSFDRFANQATGSLANVALGFQDGEEAAKNLARSMLTELLGALIRMAAQALIGQRTVEASTVASAGVIGGAMAGPAALTSLATAGANAAPAQLGMATTAGLAQSIALGPGRLHGGDVQPGTIYPITEDGRPEILMQGGKQFLLPGQRGEVVSNRDMSQVHDNSQINLGGITINADQMDRERFVNMLFDSENTIYELMQSAKAARGER